MHQRRVAQWEYATRQIPAGAIEETLNQIGLAGWELVQLDIKSSSIMGIFKQPKVYDYADE
ncbi:MAG: hypothetical protein ACHQWU_16925 [Gemmatimonadales bacterium]